MLSEAEINDRANDIIPIVDEMIAIADSVSAQAELSAHFADTQLSAGEMAVAVIVHARICDALGGPAGPLISAICCNDSMEISAEEVWRKMSIGIENALARTLALYQITRRLAEESK
jgi:hypothetical protein